MSKLSKINADVVVNTKSMDAGIAEAKRKLNTFSQDLSRVREGFGKIGLSGVGGYFSAQAFTAPLRAMESYVQQLDSFASRAAAAAKAVTEGKGSFAAQGFTPSGAAFLAANEDRIKAASSAGLGLSFAQAAGEPGLSAIDSFAMGKRSLGAFAGSMFRQMMTGDVLGGGPMLTQPGEIMTNLLKMADRARFEAAAAASPNDAIAQAMQLMQRQSERPNRELNRTLEKLSNNGAPR